MSYATGNPAIGSNPASNYYSFLARKPNEGKIPLPSEMITGSNHILIIDSRERDLQKYPNPARYDITLPQKFKNVTSLELKGSIIPKTEYNVCTENNQIAFNVQNYITSCSIKEPGFGYTNGVYVLNVSPPAIAGGTTAQVTVTVTNNQVSLCVVTTRGSGYLRGNYGGLQIPSAGFYKNAGAYLDISSIPTESSMYIRYKSAHLVPNVGNELIAILNEGQYDFNIPNDSDLGLCREVTRALQAAVDGAINDGFIVPQAGEPSSGAEYFPYAGAPGDLGSCFLETSNENASANNRVCIQHGTPSGGYTQILFLELLWSSALIKYSSAMTLLGYGSSISTVQNIPPSPVDQTNGTLNLGVWESLPVVALNDYSLVNCPLYAILSFYNFPGDADRVESTNSVLDNSFAIVVFDANSSDVVFRAPDDSAPGTGTSNWASLLTKPGVIKAIKGQDFDTKILSFGPAPIAELSILNITFKKLNGDLFDFHGRDHTLILNIGSNDINSANKW